MILRYFTTFLALSSASFGAAAFTTRLSPSYRTFLSKTAAPLSTSCSPAQRLVAAATVVAVNGENTQVNGYSIPSDSASAPKTPEIRLNVYEMARTVTSVCTSGTLCTVSAQDGMQGAPFGSFVDYVLDDAGNPVLLMNDMSMHTVNIQNAANQDGGAGMVTLFTQMGGGASMPAATTPSIGGGAAAAAAPKGSQDVSRCSLTGHLLEIPRDAPDMDVIRMRYSLTHVYADQVMDSPKFRFYRLVPSKIYFVGGFGVLAKWVDPQDYQNAAPDILAADSRVMVAKLNNGQHQEDLLLTAQHLLNIASPIEKVRVTSIDRLGLDVRVTFQKGTRRNKLQTDEFRIGFRIPVLSVEDAKSEVLKVFQEAWEKGNGMSWDADDELPGQTVPIVKIAADSLE